jgi:hypothetical protein
MSLYPCVFDGRAFVPTTAFHLRRAADDFGAGEIVMLNAEHERSAKTHSHQFATIADYWSNLPESMACQPYAKSSDTLRKHALIATGHCNCEVIVCGSKAAAERVGAYVGHLATQAHGYAITEARDGTVKVWTPHSQSKAAMGAEEFQRSKSNVLEWIERLLAGVAA